MKKPFGLLLGAAFVLFPTLAVGETFFPPNTTPNAPITPATATATQALVIGGQYNSTQATFTNGQQGSLQFSSRGEAKTNIMDAAGNARGANVNASNQLSVSVDNTPAVTQSGAWTVTLGAGSAIAAKVGIDQTSPGSTNGTTVAPTSASAAAMTSAYESAATESGHAAVCAAACNFYSAYALNVSASVPLWLFIFNSLTVPANGAVTPKHFLNLPINSTTGIQLSGMPMERFATGLSVACSSTAPPTLTASSNCWFKVMAQ